MKDDSKGESWESRQFRPPNPISTARRSSVPLVGSARHTLLRVSATRCNITTHRYQQQLTKLRQEIAVKRPEWAQQHGKLILLHDNARAHVAQSKDDSKGESWESRQFRPPNPISTARRSSVPLVGSARHTLLRVSATRCNITTHRYQQQLTKLRQEIAVKRPEWAQQHGKLILLHDNARAHVAQSVNDTLKASNEKS
ncbi:hypothetical protein LAZ67_5004238 [Cordylochernes scorpioides]|uniref:Transposase n=1 Tax=Cordylochernes scorpioides TaxID=51811 RepID=A0ABY6KIT9_9ARAC|nr:hypothetical protein LAZ67_5004238 [Cordylochernes scorpioides]